MEKNSMGAIIKVIDDPNFLLNYKDQETKNLIFAIEITDEKPFKCYLFTSPEKESNYKNNKHYNGINSVEIVSGERIRKVINEFFLAFEIARQNAR